MKRRVVFAGGVLPLLALGSCDTPADNAAWDRFADAFCERTVQCGNLACETFWAVTDDACRLEDGPDLDFCLDALADAPCDDTVVSTHFALPDACAAIIHGCEFDPQ